MQRSARMSLVLGAAAVSLLAGACQSDSDQRYPVQSKAQGSTTSEAPPARAAEHRDSALVRFIDTVPEMSGLDLYADSMMVMTNSTYKTVTPYQELPGESLAFRIRPANQHMAEPLDTESEGLSAGNHYTIVAFSDADAAKADLAVFKDDLAPPDAGKAKLRVINAAPDLSEIDVMMPGSEKALFSGVNYKSATKFANVSPLRSTIQIHREGEKTPVLEVPAMNIEAGRIYTLLIVGRATGTPKLETLQVEDRLGNLP